MNKETVFQWKSKTQTDPKNKPRVYFTCHPDDFDRYFEKICNDIFKTHDCAIFYTEDMTEEITHENSLIDLERMNLFVMPITFRLLTSPNRAMDNDFRFAEEKHIPVLPIMMEPGIESFYSKRFGERQFLNPYSGDSTEISYEEKLKKYLESVLISDELAQRIRKAFDAYIFLSYRKKDRKYANDLMRLIHSNPECRDIAIWFDEFLTPGESFKENIDKMLDRSELFALLVTPNLLEKPNGIPNFVMAEEYPRAYEKGKSILPAEMERTDKTALRSFYEELPECVDARNDAEFRERLLDSIKQVAISSNNNDPEHNYLIGLAYLDGIDVEQNIERAVELITRAAEAELPEAMKKLSEMYHDGEGVAINYQEVLKWEQRLCDYYETTRGKEHPLTLSWLNELAVTYSYLGDTLKCMSLNEKIYPLRCKVFGETHSDSITSLNNLAAAYNNFGSYKRAQERAEKAYNMSCLLFGEEHPTTLTSLSILATAYGGIGNIDKKLEIDERVYNLRCKIIGDIHPDTLAALNNLAVAYGQCGNRRKEIELLRRAYTLCREVQGSEHPQTLIPLYNLAFAYEELGNYKIAFNHYKDVYTGSLKILGEEHPDTRLALEKLTHIYWKCFCAKEEIDTDCNHAFWVEKFLELAECAFNSVKYDEAKELYSRAFAVQKHYNMRLPFDDKKMAVVYSNLGYLYIKQGQYNDSAKYYDQAIGLLEPLYALCPEKYIQYLAENYYGIGYCHRLLGQVVSAEKNYQIAIELYERLYKSRSEVIDKEHPDAAWALSAIGQCYSDLGQHSKSIVYYDKAYELLYQFYGKNDLPTEMIRDFLMKEYCIVWEQEGKLNLYLKEYEIACGLFGEKHPDTLTAQHDLAYSYWELGNHRLALEIYQEVYRLRCEVLGEEHPDTLTSLSNLALAYGELGDRQKELELDQKAYSLRFKVLGAEHLSTLISLNNMACTYRDLRNYRTALELFEKLYSIYRKVLGEDHPKTQKTLRRIGEVKEEIRNQE